ncbi:hypothetical protein [Arthrobacter sp. N199823]|uniref:hypothetical protein n=1 Tax=Arthrobacter sp. N199823 TaxID=2058895 RepID=UPI001CA48877|nr:hypothetical protein [Arthrobacter sp. N199823]
MDVAQPGVAIRELGNVVVELVEEVAFARHLVGKSVRRLPQSDGAAHGAGPTRSRLKFAAQGHSQPELPTVAASNTCWGVPSISDSCTILNSLAIMTP